MDTKIHTMFKLNKILRSTWLLINPIVKLLSLVYDFDTTLEYLRIKKNILTIQNKKYITKWQNS